MLQDRLDRVVKDLRISVTDRCNLRCTYCMPYDEYVWIDRSEILTYEEVARLARIFVELGVEKVRLTGGEPLARKDLEILVSELSRLPGLSDLCLTTNGSFLAEKAAGLKAAGLGRINVSIDTLDPEKFKRITRRGDLARVLEGLFAARSCGFSPIKINAVIERGVNDDEILGLVEFSRNNGFAIRFIEYMDVGNANNWGSGRVVSKEEILRTIRTRFPLQEVGREDGSAPSVDYRFLDGIGDIGVIASVTEPFCSSCTRARLTADGKLVTCLFSDVGYDLKALIRNNASDQEVSEAIRAVWTKRTDRYSDERLEALNSPHGYRAKDHKKIEMISLGG
jgi:cyclic pyranopterin phosphate synthase